VRRKGCEQSKETNTGDGKPRNEGHRQAEAENFYLLRQEYWKPSLAAQFAIADVAHEISQLRTASLALRRHHQLLFNITRG
jgi:hypothetical protein